MSVQAERVDKLSLKVQAGLLDEKRLVAIAREDPDTFVNFMMSWNAIKSGPNKLYQPSQVYTFPYGSSGKLSGQTTAMTCSMHREWQDSFTNSDKVFIESPREHAKTLRMAIGRGIWELGRNHDLRIKVVCQNDEKAAEIVQAMGQNILLNENIKKVFPDLEPDEFGTWSAHKLTVKRGAIMRDASVEATGVLATGVSGRADILFFDDVADFKNAIEFPTMRERVKQVFKDVWLNLLPSSWGKVSYCCTPWHMRDLSMEIKNDFKNVYDIKSYPINDDLDPLWPDKWGREDLARRRRDIGQRAFDRGFHLRPLSDSDLLFREEMFEKCYDFNLEFGKLPGGFKGCHFYSGVDLGSSGKTENPRTSMFTFAEKKGLCVPVEIKAARFGEIEKIKQMKATHDKFRSDIVAVENNSYQETTIKLMKELGLRMPVKGLYTGGDKVDLETGLPSLEIEVENKVWLIPVAGHSLDNDGHLKKDGCPVCQWLEECFSYPIGFSDVLMSWWIAREGYRNLRGKLGLNLVHSFASRVSKPSKIYTPEDLEDEEAEDED